MISRKKTIRLNSLKNKNPLRSWKNNSHNWKRLSRKKNTQPSQGKKKSKSLSKWENIDPLKKKKTPSQQGKRSLIPEEKKETQFYHKNRNLNTLTRKKLSLIQKKLDPLKRKEKKLNFLSLSKKHSHEKIKLNTLKTRKTITTLWREK